MLDERNGQPGQQLQLPSGRTPTRRPACLPACQSPEEPLLLQCQWPHLERAQEPAGQSQTALQEEEVVAKDDSRRGTMACREGGGEEPQHNMESSRLLCQPEDRTLLCSAIENKG